VVPAAGLALACAVRQRLRGAPQIDLHGQTAVITGGSRGRGLAIARELVGGGCAIVLLARDANELERASRDLAARGAGVLTIPCDVTDRDQVGAALDRAVAQFGRVDILVNAAGIMSVGPVETQTIEDFRRAMNVMFWGVLYPTFALLPHMHSRGTGHIINITSIGGKVSVQHMLPYSAAKFAAVGFSEGLHAELASTGINVLTVVPGLMRTGSHVNAMFKGQHRAEFGWFSLAASLPVTSISAEDAAAPDRHGYGESRLGDHSHMAGGGRCAAARLDTGNDDRRIESGRSAAACRRRHRVGGSGAAGIC
jgi:NAD(P)-dependent dehydrogenase (short-subunit alcohol dehydrogenase family)